MARLTIEDCLQHVDNRYDLVLLASRRARQISRGKEILLEQENDNKPTVIALREIAAGLITADNIDAVEVIDSSGTFAIAETDMAERPL